MGTPLTNQLITCLSNQLNTFITTSGLPTLLDEQSSYEKTTQKINSLNAATAVLNREFHQNAVVSGGIGYTAPMFGINQDVLLLGFYFSYLFLVVILCITYYKQSGSWQQTLYGFLGSLFLLFVITGLLLRTA
jgi:hypothetical protein